jgi:O-antigen/teichoic acid export membrane protein
MHISVKYMAAAVAPCALMVSILSGNFTAMILGRGYALSSAPLAIVIWTIFLLSLYVIPSHALQAARQTKAVAIMSGCIMIVNLGLNLALIGKFSYLAASYVSVLTHLLILIVLVVLFNLKIGRTNFKAILFKIGASLIPAGLLMFYLREKINFLAAGASGIAVYCAFMFIFKYLDDDDMGILKRLLKKEA